MFKPFQKSGRRSLSSRDWEANIDRVVIEECAPQDDALGWRAKFYVDDVSATGNQKFFVVGASFLSQRARNLETAGYKAPMTRKAINLLEGQLGRPLCPADA